MQYPNTTTLHLNLCLSALFKTELICNGLNSTLLTQLKEQFLALDQSDIQLVWVLIISTQQCSSRLDTGQPQAISAA